MVFYCNGKQGICSIAHNKKAFIECPKDCKYFDDSGGFELKTNFDRIKVMSVEETAEDLTKLFYKVASYTNAKDYIKQYLESEVQEDD